MLHGSLAFNGTARGAIRNIDVKGHLAADNIEVKLGTTTDVQLDSVVADAEYAPSRGVAVGDSTIKRGTAILDLAGTAVPHRVVSRRGVVSYNWDNDTAINASVQLSNAQIPDLLQIAGQGNKVDLTGIASINAHVSGSLGNPNGSGNITLTNGVAYGEGYQKASVDATVLGQQIDVSRLLLQLHGMQVTGTAGYNLTSKHINANLSGGDLRLSKFDTVQKANAGADGVLSFTASANGTVEQPNLKAQLISPTSSRRVSHSGS